MAIFITVIMSNISKIAKLIDDKAITFIMVIRAIVTIRVIKVIMGITFIMAIKALIAMTIIVNITSITAIVIIKGIIITISNKATMLQSFRPT